MKLKHKVKPFELYSQFTFAANIVVFWVNYNLKEGIASR